MTATPAPIDVLLVSADLFIGSRIRAAAAAQGLTLESAGSGTRAVECLQSTANYRLVLVDLETPALQIDALTAICGADGPPVVAYGPHVHEKRLEAARAAGCQRVLTRGKFDATLPQLLREMLAAD